MRPRDGAAEPARRRRARGGRRRRSDRHADGPRRAAHDELGARRPGVGHARGGAAVRRPDEHPRAAARVAPSRSTPSWGSASRRRRTSWASSCGSSAAATRRCAGTSRRRWRRSLAGSRGAGEPIDCVVICPAFPEAGRVTLTARTSSARTVELLPAAETDYARDPPFGYRSSALAAWVRERAGADVGVVAVTLDDVRLGGPEGVAERLSEARGTVRYVVADAAEPADLDVLAAGVVLAERQACGILSRTGPSFLGARAGRATAAPLAPAEVAMPGGRGLVVVGSHTELTTAQLARGARTARAGARDARRRRLLGADRRAARARGGRRRAAGARRWRAGDAALVTSRRIARAARGADSLYDDPRDRRRACRRRCARSASRRRLDWLVAKGGITAHDMAVRALRTRRATVLGQLFPGQVSVWELGAGSAQPGLRYVVFPGNVGRPRGRSRCALDRLKERRVTPLRSDAGALRHGARRRAARWSASRSTTSSRGSRSSRAAEAERAAGAAAGRIERVPLRGSRAAGAARARARGDGGARRRRAPRPRDRPRRGRGVPAARLHLGDVRRLGAAAGGERPSDGARGRAPRTTPARGSKRSWPGIAGDEDESTGRARRRADGPACRGPLRRRRRASTRSPSRSATSTASRPSRSRSTSSGWPASPSWSTSRSSCTARPGCRTTTCRPRSRSASPSSTSTPSCGAPSAQACCATAAAPPAGDAIATAARAARRGDAGRRAGEAARVHRRAAQRRGRGSAMTSRRERRRPALGRAQAAARTDRQDAGGGDASSWPVTPASTTRSSTPSTARAT